MGMTLLLTLSLACQAAAAILAIRLIWLTRRRWAWGLVAGAIVLMIARRGASLFSPGNTLPAYDLSFELAGLAISMLMLSGIMGMFSIFRSFHESDRSSRASQRRLQHLNAVLRGVGNVSQLVATEKDRGRLIAAACARLTESRGYRQAWIAILGDSPDQAAFAEAGLGTSLQAVRERFGAGVLPSCLQEVLSRAGVHVLGREACDNGACPVCKLHSDGRTMAVRLAMGNARYGVMAASLPADAEVDEENRHLLQEAADDLSFGLHGLLLEQERQRAEKGLRLDDSRLETLLHLNQMSEASFQDIANFALEEAVRLTESRIGYLAFTNADETELTMYSWSTTAMDECRIIDKPIVYQVEETGLWGEAVRQRRPVITNDYAAPNPAKKGYPVGHVAVTRHVNVPVFDGSRIVLVAGVGNKEEPYDESDIRQLTLLMQGMWQLIQRRRANEEIRRTRDELEIRVRERTSELAVANEELKQERYLLHTLMDNLPHSIYFKDAESRFLRINRALANYFGLADPAQARGKTDLDFFTAEHAGQALADEQKIVRTGRPLLDKKEKETWPDGRVTWASTTKMPLYDDAGRIVGSFGISRDITAQSRAEEALRISETKYRTLYDSSRNAIMMLTPEEGFLSGNPATIALFGCRDEEEFKSLTPVALSPQYQHDGTLSSVKAQQMMAEALEQGSHFFEWTHTRVDGREFVASVLLTRMELEGRTALQATVRDITDEKRAAEVLRATKEAAEAASRAKSTFLANMSHEIRTPLNAVIGMTELVLKSKLTAQQREFLMTVKDSGEALLSVINDILDFSKIEAGKLVLDCRAFDLWENLGDTMRSFAIHAHQQGLELACGIHRDVPHLVVGDYNRLRQIVVNLVGNAIKYTEKGEVTVEVALESRSEKDVLLHFTVTDTGIGIPPDKQAVIFDIFEQGDASTTRRHGGTGLGLAIASRLVNLMEGRIWVESEIDQGSRFHFFVRLALAGSEPREVTHPEPVCLHGLRVLVVDDNASNRRILEEFLRSWGMAPTLAPGGAQALQLLREAQGEGHPFRLVLSDAHMPQMDGFALAEAIRGDLAVGSTVVMMLTSGDRAEDPARCKELGIASYLLKPVKHSELLAAIEHAMGVAVSREAVSPSAEQQGPGGLRILLAEDSLVNQKLAIALLEGQGHRVTVARNGREALAVSEIEEFDLVLMDVQMPEMDGLETTVAIRAAERGMGRRLPIIAMTAHALQGDRERCLDAGMDGYIAKPIRAKELFDTMRSLVPSAPPQPAPPSPALVSDDVIDWNEVLKGLQGDATLLEAIVEAAAEEIPDLIAAAGQAIARSDAAALRSSAHTLKGALRYFGKAHICEEVFRMECMGKDHDLKGATMLFEMLEPRLNRIAQCLQDYWQQRKAPEG